MKPDLHSLSPWRTPGVGLGLPPSISASPLSPGAEGHTVQGPWGGGQGRKGARPSAALEMGGTGRN